MQQCSHYRGPRRRRERDGAWEDIEEMTAENSPNVEKEAVIQVLEVQRVPQRPNQSGNTSRHIIIKWTKIKEKTLKATRENQQITYERIAVRLSADFSTDSLQTRKEWHNIFKVVKRKNLQEYSTQQGSHSYLIEKSKVYKQRIQHHQKALQQILKELH